MRQHLTHAGMALLLVLGIVSAGCLDPSQFTARNGTEQQLLDRIEELEEQNSDLHEQLEQLNLSLQGYEDQLAFYRSVVSLPAGENAAPGAEPVSGSASLEAPAVLQRTVYEQDGPFSFQRTELTGSLLNVTVDIVPGRGRVLVNTTPLMGTTFQDAANTAAYVAQNRTGRNLSSSDVIVSIVAEDRVPAVDGGSAGALMTLLMVAAIEGNHPRPDVIMTGTIDHEGRVGAIGGVVEKARAAKEGGKSLLLLPRENSRLVRYTERIRDYGAFSLMERVPEAVDAKTYLESEVGIRVEYIDTIGDVLRLSR